MFCKYLLVSIAYGTTLLFLSPHLRCKKYKSMVSLVRMSTQPNQSIIVDPDDVNRQLSELGLTASLLATVARAAALERLSATPLHPPTAAGFMQWAGGVVSLREQTITLGGWDPVNVKNQGLTVNRGLGIVIAVAGGDKDTGLAKGIPTTRCKRGPATKKAIDDNSAQLQLFPEYFELPEEIKDEEYGIFWLLLIYVDQERQEVRSELSRPMGWKSDRRPSGFAPRVILPSIDIDGDLGSRTGWAPDLPKTPEVTIEIKRRA
jgi:hypothetical protein